MKKALIVVGIIVLVLVVGFVLIIQSGNKANDERRGVIDTVIGDLKKGDTEAVYHLTGKHFQEKTSVDSFKQSLARTALFSSTTQYQVSFVQDGKYTGTLTDAQGKQHTFRFTFVDEEGKEALQNLEFDYPKDEPKIEKGNAVQRGRVDEIRVSDKTVNFMDEPSVTRFSPATEIIHLGALVAQANNAKAHMTLEYVSTGDKIGPVEDTPSGWYYFLGRGSFQAVYFQVTRPTNGWLPGLYRARIEMDGAESKTFDFTIQK